MTEPSSADGGLATPPRPEQERCAFAEEAAAWAASAAVRFGRKPAFEPEFRD